MTINNASNLHPDDLLLFNEIAGAMRRVARTYELPLKSISAFPMPDKGMADRLGQCSSTGDIHLVMRATVDGVWEEHPRTPALVWKTAAHELSHLRHFPHGLAHETFQLELEQALANQQVDHRQRVIDRLIKMQASRDGEAALGNMEAAEAFAGAVNRMLIEHELHPSDLDYARATDRDPVIELMVNLSKYRIEPQKKRIAWQESLARIVANAHLCTFLLRPGSNDIWFVGTTSHVTVAEYVYGTLVPATDTLSQAAYRAFLYELYKQNGHRRGGDGFRESWLAGFLTRISERFDTARQSAVAEAPEGPSTALMRLDGAMVKVRTFMDAKFKKRGRGAAFIKRMTGQHAEGRARGRAAADAMVLGRRGVTSRTSRKLLQ